MASSFSGKSSKGMARAATNELLQPDDLPDIHEEEPNDLCDEAEADNAEEFQEAEEQLPEDDSVDQEDTAAYTEVSDAVAELAQVLTVTSKKLQATVLGRKFSGRPRTIEERKKTSSCTARGQMGHWKGDAACSLSADAGKSSSKGRGQQQSRDGKGGASSHSSYKRSSAVRFPDQHHEAQSGAHHEPSNEISNDDAPASFFTFVNTYNLHIEHTNYVTELVDFSGSMVLDTACQRSCCGPLWLSPHSKILDKYRLKVKTAPTTDVFQFGSGGPKKALHRAYMPAALDGQETQGLLLGVSVVRADVPFLASNTLLQKLGCAINMFEGFVYFHVLGVKLPLEYKRGHIAVKITCFPSNVAQHEVWKQLRSDSLWHIRIPKFCLRQHFWHEKRSSISIIPTPPMPNIGLPPQWIQSWKQIVIKVMLLEFRCLTGMSRLVSFGLRPRSWLTSWEQTTLKEEQALEVAVTTKTYDQNTCAHPDFRRDGNKHGSYAQCKRCLKKLREKATQKGWLQVGSRSSSQSVPLPLPSSQNIIPPGITSTTSMKGSKPKQKAKAKGKGKQTSGALPWPGEDRDSEDNRWSQMSSARQSRLRDHIMVEGDTEFLNPDSDLEDMGRYPNWTFG